jgi:hypothetical protein
MHAADFAPSLRAAAKSAKKREAAAADIVKFLAAGLFAPFWVVIAAVPSDQT